MKQDRFLLAIIAGIGVLVVISLVVFFARRQQLDYGPETTPEGVVRNYVVALQKRDYQRAYNYLADSGNKPTYESFRQAFFSNQMNQNNASLILGDVQITGDQAYISVSLTYSNTGLLGDSNRDVQNVALEKQNGVWKIRSMPFPYFSYDWYLVPPNAPVAPTLTALPVK